MSFSSTTSTVAPDATVRAATQPRSLEEDTIRHLVPESPQDVVALTPQQLRRIKSFCDGFEQRAMLARVSPLTPALAEELLRAGYIPNRAIDWHWVKVLAGDMQRGDWMLHHMGLAITDDGYLIDGRHRCCAVLLTGKTVDTLITFGVKKETFDVIDQGKIRSLAAILGMAGEGDTKVLAATLRLLWLWENGCLVRGRYQRRATIRELESVLHRYEHDIREAVRVSKEYMGLLTRPGTAMLFALFQQRDANQAVEFFTKLKTGVGFQRPDDPVCVVREKLGALRQRAMNRVSRAMVPSMLAYTVMGWNLLRKHESRRTLPPWDEQEFPTII